MTGADVSLGLEEFIVTGERYHAALLPSGVFIPAFATILKTADCVEPIARAICVQLNCPVRAISRPRAF